MHTENPQEKVRRNEIWEESERNRSRTYTSFRRFADSSIAHANFRQYDGLASFLLSVLSLDNTLMAARRKVAKAQGAPMGPFYRLPSRNAVSCDFDNAPTFCAATAPFLNRISVGMPRTPNLTGVDWCSSTLILAICRRSA